MFSLVKDVILSTRPWSFLATLSCSVIYISVVLSSREYRLAWEPLKRVAFVLLGALSGHAGTNLLNTYVDFVSGVDRKNRADDRTLVDGILSPAFVLGLGLACFSGALGVLYFVVQQQGALLLPVGSVGLLIGALYSMGPLSLKRWGLGDVAVFLAFGPLLMCGLALCTMGAVGTLTTCATSVNRATLPSLGENQSYLGYLASAVGVAFDPENLIGAFGCVSKAAPALPPFSIAMGLMVVQILHANNVRDLDNDSEKGLWTLARLLGFKGSLILFATTYFVAFASAALGVIQHAGFLNLAMVKDGDWVLQEDGNTPVGSGSILLRMYESLLEDYKWAKESKETTSFAQVLGSVIVRGGVMVLIMGLLLIPVAWELVRRMSAKELRSLPQSCAQFLSVFALSTLAAGDFVPHQLTAMCFRFATSVLCLFFYQPMMAAAEDSKEFHAAEVMAVAEEGGPGAVAEPARQRLPVRGRSRTRKVSVTPSTGGPPVP